MQKNRFGRRLKLPSTIAIKHQVRTLMFEDSIREDAGQGIEAILLQPKEPPAEAAVLRFNS
jgi:hypothetical protein